MIRMDSELSKIKVFERYYKYIISVLYIGIGWPVYVIDTHYFRKYYCF